MGGEAHHRLILLPVDDIEQGWPLVLPFAEQMARRFPDDWPPEETLRQAREGVLKLWLAHDEERRILVACAGTKIVLRPSGRQTCLIPWCAGHQPERWIHLLKGLEDYAKAQGCAAIEIVPGSRAGWRRYFSNYKVRLTVTLTKEL